MKKILLTLPVLALALCACTYELDYISDRDTELIVLNAMLRTDQTEHVVWLSESRCDGILQLSDAQLRCYVNGTLVAEAEETPEEITRVAGKYVFSAEIRPGDEVRLEASYKKLKAQATAIAPVPALLAGVDTASLARSPYYFSGKYDCPTLSCKLRLQDIPDQPNWFRIHVHYDEMGLEDPFHQLYEHGINFDFNRDPILCDGNPQPLKIDAYQELISALSRETAYCKFRDSEFADKTAEVEIQIRKTEFDYFKYVLFKPDGTSMTRVKNLHIDFLSISKEEYDYLVQYEKANTDGDFELYREPVHIPSNVEGGLGFFSIASPSTRTIRIED